MLWDIFYIYRIFSIAGIFILQHWIVWCQLNGLCLSCLFQNGAITTVIPRFALCASRGKNVLKLNNKHYWNVCFRILVRFLHLYNKRRYVCLSVSTCMFRMAGQTAGPIETKLDTRTHVHPGSVSVKVNVKVIHVCVREWRNYETPGTLRESDTWRTLTKLRSDG